MMWIKLLRGLDIGRQILYFSCYKNYSNQELKWKLIE